MEKPVLSQYEVPAVQVYELQVENALLTVSGREGYDNSTNNPFIA